MNKTFIETAITIGELVEQKNAAYGSSFAKADAFLWILFPDGIPPDRFGDALLLVRIFDKMMRIATDKDALGESPYQDIAGYGILGVSLHHERNECASQPSTPVDSARGPAAGGILAGAPSFVLRSAREPITPSASVPSVTSSASSCSPQPASSSLSAATKDASAPGATAHVLSDEAAHQSLSSNNREECAHCFEPLPPGDIAMRTYSTRDGRVTLGFCKDDCADMYGAVHGLLTR